ncbi:MAG: hypothetical protein ABR612_14880 [Chromatocurvus sp.]
MSNKDPRMLAMCPLRLTIIEKNGQASVLFVRPTHAAEHSLTRDVLQEVESEVIGAIRRGIAQAGGG